MGAITGITGTISWTGTENAFLASTGLAPASFSIDFSGADFDTTTFATTGSQAHIKGLRGISGEWTAMLVSPDHGGGSNGSVTFPSVSGPATVLNISSWSMDITRNSHEVTAFGGTAMAYIPGTWGATGRFSGFLDDTTAIPDINGSNSLEPVAAVFKYQEKGATDNTLSGTAFATNLGVRVQTNAPNAYDYAYRINGDITQSTPSAGSGILPSGSAIVGSAAGALVLTASTGRTYSTNAFWTGISIEVASTRLTTVRVRWQSSDGSMAFA